MQHRQISAAHPRLIGDHSGVFGVGLGFATAVGSRGLPHRATSQITHRLPSVGQHRQQQAGIHRGQVDRPGHPLGHGVDLGHQCPDGLLVVDQLARELHRAGVVDDYDPVMFLAERNTHHDHAFRHDPPHRRHPRRRHRHRSRPRGPARPRRGSLGVRPEARVRPLRLLQRRATTPSTGRCCPTTGSTNCAASTPSSSAPSAGPRWCPTTSRCGAACCSSAAPSTSTSTCARSG